MTDQVENAAGEVFEVVEKTPPLDEIENAEELRDPETGAVPVTTVEFEGETYDVGPDVYILRGADGETRLVHRTVYEVEFTEVSA